MSFAKINEVLADCADTVSRGLLTLKERAYDARIALALPKHVGNAIYLEKLTSKPITNPNRVPTAEVVFYFVHGYADTYDCMLPLRDSMHAMYVDLARIPGSNIAKFDITMRVVNYQNRFRPNRSIESFSRELLQIIRINGDTGKNIIFVTHSCGGLETAYFTEFIAPFYGIKVLKNYLIASPVGGSVFASLNLKFLARNAAYRQMALDSDFLNKLNLTVRNNSGKYKFIAAAVDWVVKQKSAIPDYSTDFAVIPMSSHASVLNKTKLFAEIFSDSHTTILNSFPLFTSVPITISTPVVSLVVLSSKLRFVCTPVPAPTIDPIVASGFTTEPTCMLYSQVNARIKGGCK